MKNLNQLFFIFIWGTIGLTQTCLSMTMDKTLDIYNNTADYVPEFQEKLWHNLPLHRAARTFNIKTNPDTGKFVKIQTDVKTIELFIRENQRKELFFATLFHPDANGETPLHIAIRQTVFPTSFGHARFRTRISPGHLKIIRLLLGSKKTEARNKHLFTAGVKKQNKNGFTALHYAAYYNLPEGIDLLLKTEPKLMRIKDKWGRTAIHWAVLCRNKEAAICLVKHKTNTREPDKFRKTALDYAKKTDTDDNDYDETEMIALLSRRKKRTPLSQRSYR